MGKIYADASVSITELKEEPLGHHRAGRGLSGRVPTAAFEALLDKLEDVELTAIVKGREGHAEVEVSLDDL